ncbi:MAG TPA: type II CAAX endopeptidase family protein [Puia sp.]|nr:type II CAAX endopeptidase family protein [Puia sp.]
MAWSKLPLILRAVLTGFAVSSAGIAIWSIMLSGIAAPWSILPMIIALWAYLKFFSGSWGSKKNGEARKNNFRSINLSPSVWKWGIAAAILFVIILQASFVITFRIIDFPSEKFTADYKVLDSMPLWVAWAVLIMGSIVAGICEETGFRGYMQVPLENEYGPSRAIIITSIIFMLIHLSHSWASPILPHIFFASVLLGILAYKTGSLIPGIVGHSILDIFDYSIWWSDLTGGFHKLTIFKTGLDIHFIFWSLIFILGIFAFFRSIGRLHKGDRA